MPGKRIKDQQYYVYIKARNKGMTQVTSAAKAGFSERTGRNLEKQGIPPSKKIRRYGKGVRIHLWGYGTNFLSLY